MRRLLKKLALNSVGLKRSWQSCVQKTIPWRSRDSNSIGVVEYFPQTQHHRSINMDQSDQTDHPLYTYTKDDFIHHTASWMDKTSQKLSKFDQALHKRWDRAMERGAFRYDIDHIITRILPGKKQYVGQLNTLRATERRKPQDITSVSQPFNPKAFNFSWVKDDELIFDLENVTDSPNGTTNGASNGSVTNGSATNGSATNGVSNGKEVEEETAIHRLIINVSPMEYGHCLLVPQINLQKPQVLTQTSLECAIELMLLSNHRGFRMGFNSLCAFASVNHLHFHVYYLEYELIVDHCPVRHLGGKFFEFTALPCPGFALQLHGSTVKEMAREAHKISSYFHKADLAHNVFICRGTVFGEERGSSLTTVRLFIWPRKKFIASQVLEVSQGNKSSEEFNVACIELGGHLPIKEEEGYYKLTEADVDAIIDDANLPRPEYETIRDTITKMGKYDMDYEGVLKMDSNGVGSTETNGVSSSKTNGVSDEAC